MIRATYSWTLDEGADAAAFEADWADRTRQIRADQDGALGSVLLRGADDARVYMAVARWATRDALEAFWAQPSTPLAGVTSTGVQVYDEVVDLTVDPG